MYDIENQLVRGNFYNEVLFCTIGIGHFQMPKLDYQSCSKVTMYHHGVWLPIALSPWQWLSTGNTVMTLASSSTPMMDWSEKMVATASW